MAAAKSTTLDLAYTARYYYQGNRKSFYQIYVVNHTGVGRRQITDNKFDSYAPMWIDQSHLAWVEVYKPLPTSQSGEEPKAKMRVMLIDLRNGKRRKLAEIPPHEFFYEPYSNKNEFEVHDHGPDSTIIDTTYRVSLSGIAKVANRESGFLDGEDFGQETGGDTMYPSRRIAIPSKAGQWHLAWSIEHPNIISDEDASVNKNWVVMKSGWKGKTTSFRMHGNKVSQAFIDASGHPVIHTMYAFDKYRHDEYVYRLSKDFRRAVEVTKKVGIVTLFKDRNLWIGRQTGLREGAMASLDDGRGVYVGWLYVGDWQSGKQWTIADGLVDVGCYQLKPKFN